MAVVALHEEVDPMVEVVVSTMVHVSMADDDASHQSQAVEVLYLSNPVVAALDPAILDSNSLLQVTDCLDLVPNCSVVVVVVVVAATC